MNLQDCKHHSPDIDNELIVVEGLSAAANVRRARDADTQAILALQGKPVNAAKTSRARVENSAELQALKSTIGCGTAEDLNLADTRYKRIVLLFDPDADGIHCGALVQIYLHRYMPQLIDSGRVAIVRAPLLELIIPGHAEPVHAYSESHYQKLLAHLEQQNIKGYTSQRYKGVASLSVKLLREKCLDHAKRNLQLLNMKDAALAVSVFGSA
jgi:DNA gyrase subunit B/topoisomerase-4 subunit B